MSPKLYINPFVYDKDKKEYRFDPELGLVAYQQFLEQGETPPQELVELLKQHGKEQEMERIRKQKSDKYRLRVLSFLIKAELSFYDYLSELVKHVNRYLILEEVGIKKKTFPVESIIDKMTQDPEVVSVTLQFAKSIDADISAARNLLRKLIYEISYYFKYKDLISRFNQALEATGNVSIAQKALQIDPKDFYDYIKERYW